MTGLDTRAWRRIRAWVTVCTLGAGLAWSAGCSCNNDDDDGMATGTDTDPTTGSTGSTTDPDSTTTIDPTGETTDGSTSTDPTITPTTVDPSTGSTGDPNVNCGDGTVATGEICYGPAIRIETAATGVVAIGDFFDDGGLDIAAGQDGAIQIYDGDGAGNFAPPSIFATSSGVLGLAVGDFNGDDVDDVAFSDSGADEVNILLSGGNTLVPGTPVSVGAFPRGMVAVDLGGTTDLDLAVVSEDAGVVTVLFGDGTGGLTEAQTLTAGSAPLAVVAGDVDGGGLDLMAANFGGNTVSLFPAQGMMFGAEESLAAQSGPRGLAFADFDGDGTSDLVAVHQEANTAGLWRGEGDGLAPATFTAAAGTPRGVASADIDADGSADVVIALESANAFGVLRGDPSGLQPMQTFGALPRPDAVATGLLDDDASPDVVIASSGENGGIAVAFADP